MNTKNNRILQRTQCILCARAFFDILAAGTQGPVETNKENGKTEKRWKDKPRDSVCVWDAVAENKLLAQKTK